MIIPGSYHISKSCQAFLLWDIGYSGHEPTWPFAAKMIRPMETAEPFLLSAPRRLTGPLTAHY